MALAPVAVGSQPRIQFERRRDADGVPSAPGVQRLASELELVPRRNQAQACHGHQLARLVEVRLTGFGQLPQLRSHEVRLQVCVPGDLGWTNATTASDGS